MWDKPDAPSPGSFLKVIEDEKRLRSLAPDWGLRTERSEIFRTAERSRRLFHRWFTKGDSHAAAKAAHIVLDKGVPEGFHRGQDGTPTLEVHSVRPARRIGPDGQTVTELVVEMTQRRRGYYDPEIQEEVDHGKRKPPRADFIFRGGCTLLIDPDTAEVKYCIHKKILNTDRLDRTRRYLLGDETPSLGATYFGDPRLVFFQRLTARPGDAVWGAKAEPFALLHRSFDYEEVI
jgi:hypothetical protein